MLDAEFNCQLNCFALSHPWQPGFFRIKQKWNVNDGRRGGVLCNNLELERTRLLLHLVLSATPVLLQLSPVCRFCVVDPGYNEWILIFPCLPFVLIHPRQCPFWSFDQGLATGTGLKSIFYYLWKHTELNSEGSSAGQLTSRPMFYMGEKEPNLVSFNLTLHVKQRPAGQFVQLLTRRS